MANVNQNTIAIDIYRPIYTNYDFASKLSILQADTNEVDRQSGLYLQDQIGLGRWRLTIGGRYDNAKVDARNQLTGRRASSDNSAFSARAGALYLFDNGVSPYLSYSSRSSQPPVPAEMAGRSNPSPASSGRLVLNTSRARSTAC